MQTKFVRAREKCLLQKRKMLVFRGNSSFCQLIILIFCSNCWSLFADLFINSLIRKYLYPSNPTDASYSEHSKHSKLLLTNYCFCHINIKLLGTMFFLRFNKQHTARLFDFICFCWIWDNTSLICFYFYYNYYGIVKNQIYNLIFTFHRFRSTSLPRNFHKQGSPATGCPCVNTQCG